MATSCSSFVNYLPHISHACIVLCRPIRYQTNIDDILSGFSNYNVYSHYNRSIADVQLRASSFLFELVSIRDSRQSFFGSVAFTKAELAAIINHICINQLAQKSFQFIYSFVLFVCWCTALHRALSDVLFAFRARFTNKINKIIIRGIIM